MTGKKKTKDVRDEQLAVLQKHIDTGRKISTSTMYGVHAGTEEEMRMSVPARYTNWKDDSVILLSKLGFQDESELFAEADSVPLIIGGLAYGNPRSRESLMLMTKIRREVSKKLEILRSVRKSITGDSFSGKENPFLFYLSREEGLYRIVQGESQTYPVHRSKYRFQILDNLTRRFQQTDELARTVGIDSQKLRAQIAGIRNQISKKFEGISGKDFIDGEQRFGYRIGKGIDLHKR